MSDTIPIPEHPSLDVSNVQFRATPEKEGDPGKYAYLRNPNWTAKPFSQVSHVDSRICPGCVLGPRWKHTGDSRCKMRPING